MSFLLNFFSHFLFEDGEKKEDGDRDFPQWEHNCWATFNKLVKNTLLPRETALLMTILLPKSQMCSKIACHIPDKAAILLIATHHTCCRLGSRNLERETRGERRTGTWWKRACPVHAFTDCVGKETDGWSKDEIGCGRRQGRHHGLKKLALARSHPDQPPHGPGGENSVMDVPCDWSPRHAHTKTPPRPGQRSRQSKREARGPGWYRRIQLIK